MKAIILAGGKGTRLRPLTSHLPKPMVPLLNRPCIEYTLQLLREHGIRDIAITLHYLADQVMDYFGDGKDWGVHLHYFIENLPLGTAGSVRNAADFLDEPFIVMSGDTLTNLSIQEAAHFHHKNHSEATMVLKKITYPLEYGVVLTDSHQRITQFVEKPSWGQALSDKVNTGLYILEPSIFRLIPPDQEIDFSKDVFPQLLGTNKLYGFETDAYWSDIGNPESYIETQMHMLHNNFFVHKEYEEISPGIFIGEDVNIHSTAKLKSPCLIASGTRVDANVTIGPHSVIGKNNIIKQGSGIRQSILWDGVHIEQAVTMDRSIVCSMCCIGSSSTLKDGAILGIGSNLGHHTYVKEQVKIGPQQKLAPFSKVHTSVISAHQLQKYQFDHGKIRSLANVHMTPDYLTRLAAAYASEVGKGRIVVSSCSHPFAQVMRNSLISGLQSAGIEVMDAGKTLPAVNRFSIKILQAKGGIHVEMSNPGQNTESDLLFYDEKGLPISKAMHRKIENALIQEHYARVNPDEVKMPTFVPEVEDGYLRTMMDTFDLQEVRSQRFKIVVSCDRRNLQSFLVKWANHLGLQLVFLDDTTQESYLQQAVIAENADLGLWIDNNAHRLIVVSDNGIVLTEDQWWGVQLQAMLQFSLPEKVYLPVGLSPQIHNFAQQLGLEVVKVSHDFRSIMEYQEERFHPIYDVFYGISLIIQFLTNRQQRFIDLLAAIPADYQEIIQIPCPHERKGSFMREMAEQVQGKQVEFIDGMNVYQADGSVWIKPDETEPTVHLKAFASSANATKDLTKQYLDQMNKIQTGWM
ncbi:MAG TPA: sugar phosphate nucleotidyltransferase [Bacillota bacterium]|nr:sugar phosphate nucleotidyltransferase [Bacillota bacterium]